MSTQTHLKRKLARNRGAAWRRGIDTVFAASFVLAIIIPCFITLRSFRQDDEWLKEAPQAAPGGSLKERVKTDVKAVRLLLEKYPDFSPLQYRFIRMRAVTRVKWLQTPSWTHSLMGKNQWIFLNQDNAIEDFRRLNPLPAEQLKEIKDYLENANQRLAKMNVHFLVVVAPNKQTIYPENMPDAWKPVEGPAHLDQLLNAMKATQVPLIDLRPVLLEKKKRGVQTYLRADSHWSDWGSYTCYSSTCERLKTWYPSLIPISVHDMNITPVIRNDQDLPIMMGLGDLCPEPTTQIRPRSKQDIPDQKRTDSSDPHYINETTTRCARGEIRRAVIVCDSYSVMTQYLPLLSRHFQEAQWLWLRSGTYLDFEAIARAKPDVVILERAERLIVQPVYKEKSENP